MKKQLFILWSILLTANFVTAQPQWKFHIAFEDATGAKDTIWLIWDTTATFGIDTQFNEQAQPINYSVFNVFTGNVNADTTKTQALPHPHASNDVFVYAINYQYPIEVSWDSSLFHSPGLPLPVGYVNYARIDNDYFFFQNNLPLEHNFDMLQDNHVSAPAFTWFSQSQFPMRFYIHRDPFLTVNENSLKDAIKVFPNPANSFLHLNTDNSIRELSIINYQGVCVLTMKPPMNNSEIEVTHLPEGIYIIQFINNLNTYYYEKIIITH
jgi:hypothetical protein